MKNNTLFQNEDLAKLFENGTGYMNEGSFDKAISSFEEILNVDVNNSNVHYQMGKTFLMMDEKSLGFINLQEAIKNSPYDYQFITALVDFYSALRLYVLAARTLFEYAYKYSYDMDTKLINKLRQKYADIRLLIPDYQTEVLTQFENVHNEFEKYIESLYEEYISCPNIEGLLMFGHNFLAFCCVTHTSPEKGNVIICSYDGGALPFDEILEKRSRLRKENAMGVDNACKGCFLLEKKKWKKEYMFDKLMFAHSIICNLKCSYCGIINMPEKEWAIQSKQTYDTTNIVSDLISDKLLAPDSFISYAGGEPTVFKDFDSTMKLFLNMDAKVQIATNSTKYSGPVDEGLRQNKLTIITSIDAGTRENYKKIRGRDLFEKAWENIARYTESNSNAVTIQYIFMDENYSREETTKFVENCVKAGVKNVAISRDFFKYQGSMSKDDRTFPVEITDSIVDMIMQLIRNDIHFTFMHVFSNAELNTFFAKLLEAEIDDERLKEKVENVVKAMIKKNNNS